MWLWLTWLHKRRCRLGCDTLLACILRDLNGHWLRGISLLLSVHLLLRDLNGHWLRGLYRTE